MTSPCIHRRVTNPLGFWVVKGVVTLQNYMHLLLVASKPYGVQIPMPTEEEAPQVDTVIQFKLTGSTNNLAHFIPPQHAVYCVK